MLLHNMPEPSSFIAPQCIKTVSETSPTSWRGAGPSESTSPRLASIYSNPQMGPNRAPPEGGGKAPVNFRRSWAGLGRENRDG